MESCNPGELLSSARTARSGASEWLAGWRARAQGSNDLAAVLLPRPVPTLASHLCRCQAAYLTCQGTRQPVSCSLSPTKGKTTMNIALAAAITIAQIATMIGMLNEPRTPKMQAEQRRYYRPEQLQQYAKIVAKLADAATFHPDRNTRVLWLIAVVQHQSRWQYDAVGDRGTSFGLGQIRCCSLRGKPYLHSRSPTPAQRAKLFDPLQNLQRLVHWAQIRNQRCRTARGEMAAKCRKNRRKTGVLCTVNHSHVTGWHIWKMRRWLKQQRKRPETRCKATAAHGSTCCGTGSSGRNTTQY